MPNDLIPPFEPENLAGAESTAASPVSQRIRARLQASGTRYFANDNISAHIAPGEIEELVDEVSGKMQGVLESLVIDTAADHNSRDTGRRRLP